MIKAFDFHVPVKLVFGEGRHKEIGPLVGQYGKKAMIVTTGPLFRETGLVRRIQALLKESGIDSVHFGDVSPNPLSTQVDAGAEIARKEKVDVFIGLGGGSAIDAAKGMAISVGYGRPIWDFCIGEKIEEITQPACGLFNTDRFEVVTKSPLTGIFAEASAGGFWGGEFKKCGYDGFIIEGKAASPVYISIQNGRVEIKKADFVWGEYSFRSAERLIEAEGRGSRAIVIGPAGERCVTLACIIADGKHGRALGRCGVGAVMGSKRLKGIVVRGERKVSVYDKAVITAINRSMVPLVRENMAGVSKYGTSGGLADSEALGNLSIRNWRQGAWPEGAEKVTGTTMADKRLTGTYKCGSCMIGCGRVVTARGGPYDGQEIAGPEYETLGLLGTNLMNDDLDTVIKANELCNRYGLDTISIGGVIGFAMEAWERGLIGPADTGGLTLEWGSPEAVLALIEMIAENRGIGELLGKGVRKAAQEIGGDALEFAAEIKGLEPPAHDGRAKFTVAIGMATSNRGACHLSGFAHDFEEGAVLEDLGSPALTDRFAGELKAENVFRMQNLMGVMDSMVVCKFALFGGLTVNPLIKALNAVTGWDVDRDEFFRMGERIFTIKRMFNNRLGISRKDDTLPVRMLRYVRGGGTAVLPPLYEMLNEYYGYRGWDEFGRPTREKMVEHCQ